jgi:hypothetical protein
MPLSAAGARSAKKEVPTLKQGASGEEHWNQEKEVPTLKQGAGGSEAERKRRRTLEPGKKCELGG